MSVRTLGLARSSASLSAPPDASVLLRPWSPAVLADTLLLLDAAMLLASGSAAYAVAALLAHPASPPSLGEQIVAAAAAAGSSTLLLRILGLHSLRRLAEGGPFVGRAGAAILVGTAIAWSCLLLVGNSVIAASTWAGAWAGAALAALALSRGVLPGTVQGWVRSGRISYRLAVVGGELGPAFASQLEGGPDHATIAGRYVIEPTTAADLAGQSTLPGAASGGLDTLLLDLRLGRVDGVLIAAAPTGDGGAAVISQVRAALQHSVADIFLLPEARDHAPPGARPAALGQNPLLLIAERPLKGWRELHKAAFDCSIAVVLLLLLLPFLAVVAALIRLDSPGPVLFRQLRVGYDGRQFRILKFRTMHHHLADSTASRQTARDDERVTRIGRILRRYSIDELPQLLNVMQGDMSLVGPRPHAPGTSVGGCRVDEIVESYARRHRVKPGITGLAQVNGNRGSLQSAAQLMRRLDYDLDYIERCSLALDFKILVLTALRELRSRNAF